MTEVCCVAVSVVVASKGETEGGVILQAQTTQLLPGTVANCHSEERLKPIRLRKDSEPCGGLERVSTQLHK